MLGLNFPSVLLLLFCVGCSLAVRKRGRSRAKVRGGAADEGSLWKGLAAGLFEADEAPAPQRIELALAAMARKLGLRGALVTRHDRSHCAVVATLAADCQPLMRGLEAGSILSRNSLYCGSVGTATPCLVIDYASLSEWRRHMAFRERGWETCLAVSCGDDLVVSFFDSRPRPAPFTRADLLLVEQLAPWISSLAGTKAGTARPELPVLDKIRES